MGRTRKVLHRHGEANINKWMTKKGRYSRRFQPFLKRFGMDQESWIKEVTDLLPVDVDKESFIDEIKRRSKLLRAHEILSEELLSLYKAEGYAGLETLRHIMDTKLLLADYRERLEKDGVNPLSDKNYQQAHKMVLDSVKVLQDIQHKDATLKLKERELDEGGAWSVRVKDANPEPKVEDVE